MLQNQGGPSQINGSIMGLLHRTENSGPQQMPLLLKPTGVPVFTPVGGEFKTSAKDFQTSSAVSLLDIQSTMDNTLAVREATSPDSNSQSRVVKAKSFVIGKKVENQTGINLIDIESMTLPYEKQFPVKVLYEKPTFERKVYGKGDSSHEGQLRTYGVGSMSNNENGGAALLNQANLNVMANQGNAPKEVVFKNSLPKSNAVSDQQKLNEQKHRPKSATAQQIKKEAIKHSKLGSNANIKPQISYVSKVALAHKKPKLERPQSAANPTLAEMIGGPQAAQSKDQKDKSNLVPANRFEKRAISPPKVDVDIPFTQNRFQGKFGDLTKDLLKKAQEALNEEKAIALRQKEEQQLKKKKQKELAEEVKQKNMEIVKQQKEKGLERFDPRKKEQELQELKRREETLKEKERQKELRRKRKEQGRAALGLDMFNSEALAKQQQIAREKHQKEEQDNLDKALQKKVKQVISWDKPQQPQPQQFKQAKEESQPQSEEQKQLKVIEKRKLLEEQQLKLKQKIQEERKKAEEEKQRSQDNYQKLLEFQQKKRQNIAKQAQLKKQAQEEEEEEAQRQQRQQQEKSRARSKGDKEKKKSKRKASNPQEQLNELRNWIDEQLQRTEQQSADDQSSSFINIPGRVQFMDGSQVDNEKQRQGEDQLNHQQFEVDHDTSDMFSNQIITAKSQKRHQELLKGASKKKPKSNSQQVREMKYQLPGNSDLPLTEQLKFGAREDRYGLFSDNNYGELVEIKRRKIDEASKSPSKIMKQQQSKVNALGAGQKQSRDNSLGESGLQEEQQQPHDIKLSKEGMLTLINKISEFAKQREHDQMVKSIKDLEAENAAKSRSSPRAMLNLLLSEQGRKPTSNANQSVPGVIDIQKEAQRQREQQRLKELEAVVVIQKWSRGYFARQLLKEIRYEKQAQIEAEYGYFEDQVKFNSGYNLQKFLKEKQKLREQNRTQRLAESQSIQEKIGDSSNSNSYSQTFLGQQSQSKQVTGRGRSAPATTANAPGQAPQVNNFLREKAAMDPLSLIGIFAHRNAPKIVPSVVKSPVKPIDPHSQSMSQSMRRSQGAFTQSQQQLFQPLQSQTAKHHQQKHSQAQGGNKRFQQSGSDIEEDIYSDSFDREEDDQKSVKTDTVEEDIIEGSKNFSSSSNNLRPHQQQKRPFDYKQSSVIEEESIIQEDLMVSKSFKSPQGAHSRNRDDSSIAEDSLLQQHSISRSSAKRGSLREDSIEEEIEGGSGSRSDDRNKTQKSKPKEKQMTEHERQVKEFEVKIKQDEERRKGYVNEMLEEMKRYEQASMQTVVVERLEKIITQSLAQKDKLLLASRLHELELEKQHKDEITKIREEQIRLLSQLVLLGPNGAQGVAQTDEERKQILEGIQKIIDKPIVIHREEVEAQKPQNKRRIATPSDSDSEIPDEVESEKDEAQGSKTSLRRQKLKKGHQLDEDSIQESIIEEEDKAASDSIAEEIEAGEGTQVSQKHDTSDIEESIHVDGKKLQLQKNAKAKGKITNNQDSDLQKMRYAMGSEEQIRRQSKNALKKSNNGEDGQLKGSGLFEKHSFQEFTSHIFKQFLFDHNSLNQVVNELEKAIEEKKSEKEERIRKKLSRKEISPRTYKKRSSEIEKWVHQEKHELLKKQQKFMQSMGEMKVFINKLDLDKKSMLEKIGSPRQPLSSSRQHITSTSSLGHPNHLNESSSALMESSDESLGVRQARDQLRRITETQGISDPEAKAIQKKKKAAQKLLAEKERAIEMGLKTKLKEIDKQQANKMLELALNLDVQNEVNKRFEGAKRHIEESSDNFVDYSARSYSQSLGASNALNGGLSTSEDPNRKKKNVKFASPERFSSAHSHSIGESSGGDRSSNRFRSSHRMEDSIGESIKIDESYSISGDVTNKIIESSKRSTGQNQQSNRIQESVKDSIKESIPEDSQDYSDDFVQSMASDAKSNSNKVLAQSRNKLINKVNTLQDQDEDDEIGYSMNFDESIGQSQQLSKFESLNKNKNQPAVEIVDEESQEDDRQEYSRKQSQGKESQRDSEGYEEEVMSESLGASSKMISQQEVADSAATEQMHEDREVIHSSKSIEWVINLDGGQQNVEQSHRSVQRSEDELGGYSENFDDAPADIEDSQLIRQDEEDIRGLDKQGSGSSGEYDNEEEIEESEQENSEDAAMNGIDDLESFPDDVAESMDNYNERVDRITEEFLELFLQEVKENEDLRLADNNDYNLDDIEEDFKDKFPFNIKQEEPVRVVEPPKVITSLKVEEKKDPKKQADEEMRQKHAAETKRREALSNQVHSYLKYLIANIDREELIEQLERPIGNDPLQKLAYIYQMDDAQNQNSSALNVLQEFASQSVLSLDYFIATEEKFKRDHPESEFASLKGADLTESARQGQLSIQTAHHKGLFDALNQALDSERPYKEKGQPAPWSKQTRVVKNKLTIPQVEKILKTCEQKVMEWCETNAGTTLAPLPPAPPTDSENQSTPPPVLSEEERIRQAQEDKLGVLIMRELVDNEHKWIDYENEDAQVKIDLADQILDHLTGELAEIMFGLRQF